MEPCKPTLLHCFQQLSLLQSHVMCRSRYDNVVAGPINKQHYCKSLNKHYVLVIQIPAGLLLGESMKHINMNIKTQVHIVLLN